MARTILATAAMTAVLVGAVFAAVSAMSGAFSFQAWPTAPDAVPQQGAVGSDVGRERHPQHAAAPQSAPRRQSGDLVAAAPPPPVWQLSAAEAERDESGPAVHKAGRGSRPVDRDRDADRAPAAPQAEAELPAKQQDDAPAPAPVEDGPAWRSSDDDLEPERDDVGD